MSRTQVRIIHSVAFCSVSSLVISISVCLAIYQPFKIQYIYTFGCACRSCYIYSLYYHYCEHHCNYSFKKPKISLVCKGYNLFQAVKPKENLNLRAFKGITGDILNFMTERQIIKFCLKERHQNEALCLPFHRLFNVSLLSGGSTAVLITSRLLQVILWLP